MAKIVAKDLDIYAHFDANDIFYIKVVRIENSDKRNFYAQFGPLEQTLFPIPKKQFDHVLDLIKAGKICDIQYSFFKDDKLNFDE